jgi:uncharacterized Zn finger protein (UPF0148 family)
MGCPSCGSKLNRLALLKKRDFVGYCPVCDKSLLPASAIAKKASLEKKLREAQNLLRDKMSKEKEKIIASSGKNTYAHVSPPLPAGFIRQPTRAEHGVNFNERIIITLYQPTINNKHVIQQDSQIYKLWRQMIIDAGGIDSIGRGVTEMYSYRAVSSSCRQPGLSPDGKGVFAEVVHQFRYRIGT